MMPVLSVSPQLSQKNPSLRDDSSLTNAFCSGLTGEIPMLIQILVLLLIAGVCGALGQAIGGYSHGGCLVSIALGFIGALLGSWLAGALHLPELLAIPVGGMRFPIIWSIIGAALFVALINLISYRRVWLTAGQVIARFFPP